MTNKTEAAAYLAQSAYLDAEALKSLDGYKGKLIDRNGAQVLVAKSKKELWFAFRGTEPTKLNDIAADLKVTRNSALAGGKVHSGFQDELDELWADCLKEIEANSKLKTPRTIYLTGHSLGAAMATIAATRIEAECLFTFGSPRVGGKRLVQELKCPHQRFVNNNDIVTKVPPQILGYVHCGEERYFNAYGCERNPTYWQRWKDFFRGTWSGWKQGKFFDALTDHGMQNYVVLSVEASLNDIEKVDK